MNYKKFKGITRVIILGIGCLGYIQFVTAQETKSYFSELIPPSPTVAELGKYGDVPVGKYTGMTNVKVPIHKIDFQEITIPIDLTYTTSGIKVAQEASWVGLGWNLSGNAVISRQVKSYDDLSDTGDEVGYIYSKEYSYPLTDAEKQELVTANATDPIDTEPDVFQINLFGQSLKFLLNKKGSSDVISAQVLNSANTLIYYSITDKTFEVVNSLGYHFYFETKEYTTLYRSGSGNIQNISTEDYALSSVAYQVNDGGRTRHRISAWHLDRVQAPNGKFLYFEYQPGYHFSYPSFKESREFNPCNGTSAPRTTGVKSVIAFITGFEAQYLKKISGDFGSMEFILSDREDISSRYQTQTTFPLGISIDVSKKPKKLSGILVKDVNDVEVKSANLLYTYFNSDKSTDTDAHKKEKYLRLKLDGISVFNQEYGFEYINSNELPAKDSKDEDFWGFYNGKQNSRRVPSFGRLLRCHINNENAFIGHEGADRSSDIAYGKIGVLSKVIYPTKGYSEFEYESHKATVDKPTVDQNDPFANSTDFSYNYQYLKRPKIGGLYTKIEEGEFMINTAGNLPFDYNFEAVTSFQCGYNCHLGAAGPQYVFRIENVNDPSKVYELIKYSNSTSEVRERLSLPNGTYRLKINSYDWPSGGYSAAVSAKNPHAYYVNSPNETNLPFEEFDIGGTRIKSVTNRDYDDTFLNRKTYTYTEGRYGMTTSSGVLMNELLFHSRFGLYDYTPEEFSDRFMIESGTPFNLDDAANGSHIGYSFVVERQENENGEDLGMIRSNYINYKNQHLTFFIGKTLEFYPISDSKSYSDVSYGNAYLVGVDPISYDYKNGSMFSEEVIDAQGVSKTFTSYRKYNEVTVSSKPVVRTHLTNANVVAEYRYFQEGKLNLLEEKEKFDSYHDKNIKTLEKYTYNERYLKESNTIVSSEDNIEVTSFAYYPFDTEHGVSSKPYMQDLVNQNRVTIPVLNRTLQNNDVLSEQLTLFDEFSSTSMILPASIQDSKNGENLEDRFFFHEYDEDNNVLEVSEASGVHTMYIWGYQNQYPVAKITNASFVNMPAEVSSLVTQIQTASNTEDSMADEDALRLLFTELRNHAFLKNAQVSSYTYDPLIGVTSMTDSSGHTMYYEYDDFQRLEYIKDDEGKLVSRNQYHYKNQN